MAPVLTIAVPCYNVERYLDRSLPPYGDPRFVGRLEVVLVDDGSTDSTPDLLADFARKNPEVVKVITKENGGHGSAVNAALAHAEGTYFRIVDGDDWVNPDGLNAMLDVMSASEADLVVDLKREVHLITGESELFELPDYVPTGATVSFPDVCCEHDTESYVMIHTLGVRTELLRSERVSLLEKTFYEDYEYVVKATVPARTIAFHSHEVYQYLVGNASQSVSAENYVKRWDDHVRVLREIVRYEDEQAKRALDPRVKRYLARKIELMVHTLYNIALIYDHDRARGMTRAKELRSELSQRCPAHEQATRKRYRMALALHALGFDSKKLDKLMGRSLERG